jgi:hypothetical protein
VQPTVVVASYLEPEYVELREATSLLGSVLS